jgi:hypothetical protein
MKKTLLSIFCILSALSGFSQAIPNGGFETWVTANSPEHNQIPQHWATLDELTISRLDPLYGGNSTAQTASSHSGSYAMLLQVAVSHNDTIMGTSYVGDSGLGFAFTGRPEAIQGYYKFTSVHGAYIIIYTVLTKWNIGTGMRDTVAFGLAGTNASQATYLAFSDTLTYRTNSEFPDTAYIAAVLTQYPLPVPCFNEQGGSITQDRIGNYELPYIGSMAYLDDITFAGTAAGIDNIAEETPAVTIYPNPFSTTATLTMRNIHPNNATLEIYNVLGQDVKTINSINSNDVTIEKGDMQSGIYFYHLLNNGSVITTGKFIVE